MQFEKINENQIRCTLNQLDLAERHMNMKELTYGSDKARELFQEMLQTAASEYGFDAEDLPIMIEAVPLSMDSLMLVITKVDDPEELDTRFARFSPGDSSGEDDAVFDDSDMSLPERADEILNLFRKAADGQIKPQDGMMPFADSLAKLSSPAAENTEEESIRKIDLIQVYQFRKFDTVCEAARPLAGIYNGVNSLYKEQRSGRYYLSVNKSEHTPETFNQVCNILAEYGDRMQNLYATEAFFEEHCQCIIRKKALQVLADL